MKYTSVLKFFFATLSILMILVTIKTSLQVNLFHVLPGMLRDPWTVATFIDFYFNILIFFTWVVYKESSVWRSLVWLALFLGLGSIATAGYVFLQLSKLKSDEHPSAILTQRRQA